MLKCKLTKMSDQKQKSCSMKLYEGKNICTNNVINGLIKVSFRLSVKLTGYIFTSVVGVCSCNSMQRKVCNFNIWGFSENCQILCFNYSLYNVRCKKTLNSDIKSQCMHFCAAKFIPNTLKGLAHDILCLVKKRRQNKKKNGFSPITESFTYFST